MISLLDLESRPTPLVIAHRGASRAARENTIEAFETAITMGADAVELDVRRTADGVLIVHHDPYLSVEHLPIAGLTYDKLKRRARRQFHLPTLEEVLQACADRIALDIELKETGYENAVCDLAQRFYDLRNVAFTSFHDVTVARLKAIAPDAVVGLLMGQTRLASLLPAPGRLSPRRRLRRCRADLVAPHWRLLRGGYLRRMRTLRIPVWVWTVDDAAFARRLIDARVGGIISNVPDRIRALIRSTAPGT